MVHVPSSDKRRPEPSASSGEATAADGEMKRTVDDALEAEHRPANKRSKAGARYRVRKDSDDDILDEPSPLGLRLKKSPSLMELIETALNAAKKDEPEDAVASGKADKIKAANFPIHVLRIGSWERTSLSENELVAKCYFAKHKLVWEVLDAGLKKKMEIQWTDIIGLRATYQGNKLGTWDITLARPPLFFQETDPQPRKHTLWQATQDFTDGQASIHRRHILQCSQSCIRKNFAKLIRCDQRLYGLSQQPQGLLDCIYFEPQYTFLENQDDYRNSGSTFSSFCSSGFHYAASPMSNDNGLLGSVVNRPDFSSRHTLSPCSGIEAEASEGNSIKVTEERKNNWWDQLKVPGLQGSMPMTDLVSHLNHQIAEQMTSRKLSMPYGASPSKEVSEDVTQYLLIDSETYVGSDEQNLPCKPDSFCSLIKKKPGGDVLPDIHPHDTQVEQHDVGSEDDLDSTPDNEPSNPKLPITGEESAVELLVLPRVASLPELLNASGDA